VAIFPNVQSGNFPRRDWTLTQNGLRVHRGLETSGPAWRFRAMLPSGVEVGAPHWLLVLLAAVIPAGIWFPWSKQFSLRNLMVFVTIVSAVFGVIVGLTTMSRNLEFEIQEVRFQHGQIQFRLNFPENWHQFLTEIRTVDYFGFCWQGYGPILLLAIPCWFVLLIGTGLTVAAWIRWKPRLGVRPLLIATMLIAITFGLTLWTIS
jgi:hypothetical protein